jgi:serine/threonine protein phosphatase PrpC
MIANQTMSDALRTAKNPLQAARRLAAKAFSAGGRDNVSLLVARLSEGSDEQRSPRTVRAATD